MGASKSIQKPYQTELTQAAIDEWLERPRHGRVYPAVQRELARRTVEWWQGRKPTAQAVMQDWPDVLDDLRVREIIESEEPGTYSAPRRKKKKP